MDKIFQKMNHLLFSPGRVFAFCCAFVFVNLVFTGGLWRLYGLHRDRRVMDQQTQKLLIEKKELLQNIQFAKDPIFIERQAKEHFDMGDEHDLVFAFSDDKD